MRTGTKSIHFSRTAVSILRLPSARTRRPYISVLCTRGVTQLPSQGNSLLPSLLHRVEFHPAHCMPVQPWWAKSPAEPCLGRKVCAESIRGSSSPWPILLCTDCGTGLQRTDNNMEFTSWPQVNMINQKNYYTYVHSLSTHHVPFEKVHLIASFIATFYHRIEGAQSN